MQRTRDWRRAQQARIIDRFLKKERNFDYNYPNQFNDKWWDDKGNKRGFHSWNDVFDFRLTRAHRLANNPTSCSNCCCGNQRRWFKELTYQEKKFLCE